MLIGQNGYTLSSKDTPRKWDVIEQTIEEKSQFDAMKFPELK
jgi:hypothetical protein